MSIAQPVVGSHAIIPASSPHHVQVIPTSSPTPLDARPCWQVTFHAPLDNGDEVVVVGGSNMSLSPTANGVELRGGDSYTYAINNANLLYYASNAPGLKLNVEVKSL